MPRHCADHDWDSNVRRGQIDDVLISDSLVNTIDLNQLQCLEDKVDRLQDLCVLKNQPYFSVVDASTGLMSFTEALGSYAGMLNTGFIERGGENSSFYY